MNSYNSFSWTHPLLFQWICPVCTCVELFTTACLRTTMQPKSYLLRGPSIRSVSLHFGDKDAMRDKHPAQFQQDDKPRFLYTLHKSGRMTSPGGFLYTLHKCRRMTSPGVFLYTLHRFLFPVIRTRPSACLFINTWCGLPSLPRGLAGPDAPQERQSFYILGGKKPHVLLLRPINLQLRYGHV